VRAALSLIFVGILVGPATADEAKRGTVRGTVTAQRAEGVPASPILVYIVGFTEPAPETTASITQEKKSFVPDLLAITVGQTVSFPNKDALIHNVFSPTPDKFDLGSYAKGDGKNRAFPKLGVHEIYCNIHPEMNATLVVLPNRRFTIAGANGKFEIPEVPVGKWKLFAYSRRAAKPINTEITVTANAATTVDLKLDEVKRDFTHSNKYGDKYRGGGYP
jgi:plastocyanin